MEKNQRLLTIALFGIAMFVIVAPFMSAATISPVLYAPVNYTNHTGTVTYNCTNTDFDVMNISIYANSSAGTMTKLGSTVSNTSADQVVWEGSVAITSTNDGTGYNISCMMDNGTDQVYSTEIASTDIMLDSTDPVCNVSVLHPTIAYKGNQLITYYSSDAIERASTSLVIDGPGKYTTVTATGANGPLEFGSNDTKYVGSWSLDLTVTDRAGNTCTDSATFKSYMPDGVGEIGAEPEGKDPKGILIIAGLAVLAYLYFGKKK